jgi:hypothetical protein
MRVTSKIPEVLVNEAAQREAIETALKEWAKSRDITEDITYSTRHEMFCLRLDIEIQDYDYICHILGSCSDMAIAVLFKPLGVILSEEELEEVQKWTLLRNQDLQTGYFGANDGDIFKLFHFQAINFTGAKHIEPVLIENMFLAAVGTYEEFGAEYHKLVEWNSDK